MFKSNIEENHQGTPPTSCSLLASPRSYILSLSRHGNELAVGSSEGQVVILTVEGAGKDRNTRRGKEDEMGDGRGKMH